MSRFLRGKGPATFGLALILLGGCAEDNEAQITKRSRSSSRAPKGAEPPPKSQAEYGQRHLQQQQNQMKNSGYPGMK